MVTPIEINIPSTTLPSDAVAIIAAGEKRIDELFTTEQNKRIPRYLPSDATLVYSALQTVLEEDLALGTTYCEWGSGFGIGSCLAASLGYEAIGIEFEPQLVDASRELAAELGLDVDIHLSSYLPEGFDSYEGGGGEELILPTDPEERLNPTYSDTEILTEEIDVFFVYPWPGQQQFMLDLFDAVALDGALLVAYFGEGDIGVFRKVSEDDESDDFEEF